MLSVCTFKICTQVADFRESLGRTPFGGTPSDGHLNFRQSVISKRLTRKLVRQE